MREYRIDKYEEAVAEIQRYLRAASYRHDTLPHVGIDGIYGKETEEAVRAFQRLFALQVTGEVDMTTFALLYGEYVAKKRGEPNNFGAS